ncbi:MULTISPECIES: hypothetical protein [Spiroplasma]|uniref:hypothetical protein n=1 Tax=Spiroplasma TaxID=2132 RepID=UPI0025789832|nr:hypothetical protein [Spiroplasma ixodetis]WJG70464.1 hypothetical protein SIXOD_v1c16290 [Spiroplasma ixodetis Y32]
MILLLTVMLVPLLVVVIVMMMHLYSWALELCSSGNIFGVLLLTLIFNIIGTFIGCMIIYKKQHPEFKFWKSLENKIKKIFKKRNKKIKIAK